MRIYEIEDTNKSIIILSDIEIEFGNDFTQLELAYKLLEHFTGKTSDPILKSKVTFLQQKIKAFIDYEFHPDPDINLLKHMAFDLYKKLDNFK